MTLAVSNLTAQEISITSNHRGAYHLLGVEAQEGMSLYTNYCKFLKTKTTDCFSNSANILLLFFIIIRILD